MKYQNDYLKELTNYYIKNLRLKLNLNLKY